jgi:GDSL-like Lipase/Acylhydrolase family
MGAMKSESKTTGRALRPLQLGRSRSFRQKVIVGMGALVGTTLLVGIFAGHETFSVGNVLLKSVGKDQMLMSCSSLRQRSFYSEELMFTIRNWPPDEPFNTDSNCINENSESDSGDVTHCQCRNPTIPVPKTAQFWQTAFDRNQALAKNRAADLTPLDLVILGDSITEHWLGTTGGMENSAYEDSRKAFQQILTRKGGGAVDSLALGIAGDRIPNLLFRLQAAGYAKYLRPAVWWIVIGTNDMAMGWCNPDVVLAGNIAVVEEILERQPKATIVINSVLPRLPAGLRPFIDEINTRLRQYACETAADVHFFNATSIFRDDKGEVIHMSDGVHPDGPSSWTWAGEIARAVEKLAGTWW